jgi:putative spermidine/putrescine transport system permease protein
MSTHLDEVAEFVERPPIPTLTAPEVSTRRRLTPRWPAPRVLLLLAAATYLLLPFVATLLYSLASVWRNEAFPDSLTTQWWLTTFQDDRLLSAIRRSLVLALTTVVLVNIVVLPALYCAWIRNSKLRTLLQLCALVPFGLPMVIIANGLQTMVGASSLTAPLHSSVFLVATGHLVLGFPFYLWAVDGAMAAANVGQLHEAAAATGAGPASTLCRIVIPSIRNGMVVGSILAFAASLGEYSLARIITGTSFETLPVWLVAELNDTSGNPNGVAVIAVTTLVVLFAISIALARFGGRDLLPLHERKAST